MRHGIINGEGRFIGQRQNKLREAELLYSLTYPLRFDEQFRKLVTGCQFKSCFESNFQ